MYLVSVIVTGTLYCIRLQIAKFVIPSCIMNASGESVTLVDIYCTTFNSPISRISISLTPCFHFSDDDLEST